MGKLRICLGLGKWCEVILFTAGPHIHVKEHANLVAADEQPTLLTAFKQNEEPHGGPSCCSYSRHVTIYMYSWHLSQGNGGSSDKS
jgi:hypothetical protein